MHRTTCARSTRSPRPAHSRTRSRRTRRTRSRTLKDWSATLRCSRSDNWCRIDRTRSRLRHNHSPGRWCRRTSRCSHSLNRSNNSRILCRAIRRSRSLSSRRNHWSRKRFHNSRSSSDRSCNLKRLSHDRRRNRNHGRSYRNRRLHHDRSSTRHNHRRLRNHSACGRLAGNRRARSRSNNIRALPWQRNNASRSSSIGNSASCRSRHHHSLGRSRNHRTSRWRSHNHGLRTHRRSIASILFRLLALQNRLHHVARLRHLRQIELRLGFNCGLRRRRTAAAAVEVVPYPLCLVALNRTGVRLSRNPDRFKRIENRPALYFQFPRQIINSNFAHPSLFSCSLRP